MLSFLWQNLARSFSRTFFDADYPILHQLKTTNSVYFEYLFKHSSFSTDFGVEFGSESTLKTVSALHAYLKDHSTVDSVNTKFGLVFPSSSEEKSFRKYDYEDRLRLFRSSLVLAFVILMVYCVCLGTFSTVVSPGNIPALFITVALFVLCALLYNNGAPVLWRVLVKKAFYVVTPILSAFILFTNIASNVHKELKQTYEGHCDNDSSNCPCVLWSPTRVIMRCTLIIFLNNDIGLLFHHALLMSVLCWILLLPTLFPWFERQDVSSGIKYQVNHIDESVLIGVAVCFVATVVSLRQAYHREFWRRVSFIQIKKLDAFRKLIETQLSFKLPLKFQQPERYSLESSLEEFPLVTLLVCRFSAKEDGNAFTPKTNFLSLAECCLAFDQLVAANGFFKVLQVGQEYIVSSPNVYHGSESDEHNSASAAQQAALGLLRLGHLLLQVGQSITNNNGRKLKFSAALHSGPLVGGICGKNQRTYRLFGPTMDKALEMCQSSAVCTVTVSAATKELLDGSGVQFVNLEEENIPHDSTVKLSEIFLVDDSQALLRASDHLDISSLVEDEILLEDTTNSSLASTEQNNEEFESDWLQELLGAAHNTLNHSRGVFQNHRVESEFNSELQSLRLRETKIYFKTLVVFYTVYFSVISCAWIPNKQDADIRWQIPVTIGVSCVFVTCLLLRRIGGSFWPLWMHHPTWEQSQHFEAYSWIAFTLAAGSFLVQLSLSNTPFAFLGWGLYCYIRPETRTDYPHLIIGSICVIVSSLIAYVSYEGIYNQRVPYFSLISQMWMTIVYVYHKRFYNTNLRVVWILGKTLQRKHEECQWLLAESIPCKEALDFVVENQLCHMKYGVSAKSVSMTHTCTHATILNICLADYASLQSTLDVVDVVFAVDFIFRTVDTLINENSKLNSVCYPSTLAPFKMVGSSASQCQVVELLLEHSSSERLKSIYRMLRFASEVISVVESYQHERDPSLEMQLKLGLGVGNVTVGAIGFVQPTLLVYGESLQNSNWASWTSEINCVQLCGNALTLLSNHEMTSSFSIAGNIDLSSYLHPRERSCSIIGLCEHHSASSRVTNSIFSSSSERNEESMF